MLLLKKFQFLLIRIEFFVRRIFCQLRNNLMIGFGFGEVTRENSLNFKKKNLDLTWFIKKFA